MITFLNGNIFESPAYALVNPVNTVGAMGAGLALQFKKLFPHNFDVYKKACFTVQIAPGKPLFVPDKLDGVEKLIINFPTKIHWQNKSELSYISSGLRTLQEEIIRRGITSVAIPALGCGLGELPWSKVKRQIDVKLRDIQDVDIYVYEPK